MTNKLVILGNMHTLNNIWCDVEVIRIVEWKIIKIIKDSNQIHLLNAPSPGATASLAIADYLIDNFVVN